MDITKYLERINFKRHPKANKQTLIDLHQNHIFHVPFENLDIHFKRPFGLEINNIYHKVVHLNRGGFCYELNTLFNHLIASVGFKSWIIAARIYDEFGTLGPEFDHMAILVETDTKFLLDVGFGDLFTKPLEIKEGIQTDGRNQFKITKLDDNNYLISMSSDQTNFLKKYTFNLSEVQIADFSEICLDKQTNPSSYFVKNTICTKPTLDGRITIFNDKLIQKKPTTKTETPIINGTHLKEILSSNFNITQV